MLLENSGGQLLTVPERMKLLGQAEIMCKCLVVKVKSDAKEQYCIGIRGIFRETSYQFRHLNVHCIKQKVETEVFIYVLIPWK